MLKTFTGSEGKRQFESETLGYIETQSSGGPIASLLKYYGTYTHGDDEYNLVLEYADGGTWEEFMKAHSPPGREQDIISVWKSLLDVSQALHRAHLGNGYAHFLLLLHLQCRMLIFWTSIHQDVTSRNLLLKKRPLANNYGFDIKLGDFGSSNFHGHKEPGQPSLLRDMRGTKENGKPSRSKAVLATLLTSSKEHQNASVEPHTIKPLDCMFFKQPMCGLLVPFLARHASG